MKMLVSALAATSLFALSACGGGADDKAAENISEASENTADALEAQADNTSNEQVSDALEDKADQVEEQGEAAAERADDNDDPRVENQVANQVNGM